MANLDINTILVCHGVLSLEVALYMLWYSLSRRTFPGYGTWTVAAVFYASSMFLLSLRGVIPNFYSIVFGDFFSWGSILLYYEGMRLFYGKGSRLTVNVIPLALCSITVIPFFTYISPNYEFRMILLAVVIAMYLAAINLLVHKNNAGMETRWRVFIQAAFMAPLLMVVIRIVFTMFISPTHASPEQDSHAGLFLVLHLFLYLAFIIALITLHMHRFEMEYQEQKRQNEEKQRHFEALFQQAGWGVFINDLKGKIIDVNRKGCELLGYSRGEILNLGVGDVDLTFANFTNEQTEEFLLQLEQPMTMETRLRRRDGVFFPAEVILVLMEINRQTAIMGMVNDITDRKRVEEALRESEKKYRLLAENSGDIIWSMALRGSFDYISPAIERVLGYTTEEALSLSNARFLSRDSLETVKKSMAERIGSEGDHLAPEERYAPRRLEVQLIHKDGSVIWAELVSTPVRGEDGNIVGFQGAARDITDRKGAEELLKLTLESTNDGIWDYNLETKEFRHSERWAEILGFEHGEVMDLSRYLQENLHPDDAGTSSRAFMGYLEGRKKKYEAEYRLKTKSGEYKWIYSRGRVVQRTASGRPVRVVGAYTDISESKRVEEALAQTNELLLTAERLARFGAWQWDIVNDVWVISENWKQILGFSEITMSTEELKSIIHPDELDMVGQAFDDVRIHGRDLDLQHRVINMETGEERHVHATGTVERDVDGTPVRIRGAIQDVTDLRRVEKQLAESLLDLQLAQAMANIGNWTYDPALRVPTWSDQLYAIYERDPALGPPRTMPSMGLQYQKDDHETYLQSVKDAIEFGKPYEAVRKLLLPAGKEKWIHAICKPDPEPGPKGYVLRGTIQDITALKEAELALAESERRFHAIIEDVEKVAVQGYDRNRRVTYWNRASQELYGYSRKEALGRQLEDLIIPEPMREFVIHDVNMWMEEGVPIQAGELELKHKDGFAVPVYSSHVLLESSLGRKEMFCIDIDLAEIKRIHAELEKARIAAEQSNRAKSLFLANMSHEIRTPLNGIMGMLQILQQTPMDKDQRFYVSTALGSSRHFLRLLSDVLDISKIEAGSIVIQEEKFDILETLEPVISTYSQPNPVKDLRFEHHIDPKVPDKLVGDAMRIRQILFNLLGNAFKYTASGVVRLETFVLPYWRDPGVVPLHFSIIDTGIGIDPDKLGIIFETFTQGDDSFARQYGGAGLGLSIVKNLVKFMNGHISVCSEKGVGTEVHLTLPVRLVAYDPEPVAAAEPLAASLGADAVKRILIVDDDTLGRLVIEKMLRAKGYITRQVSSGREALEELGRELYDCVFMDIQMPDMHGLEATRRIREFSPFDKGKSNAMIPVIAMTAFAMDGDREAFLDGGLDEYIAKPVEREELDALLRRIFRS